MPLVCLSAGVLLTPFMTAVLGQPTVSITDQTLTGHMAVSQETASSSTWPRTALHPWPINLGRHAPPYLATMAGLFALLRRPPWNQETPAWPPWRCTTDLDGTVPGRRGQPGGSFVPETPVADGASVCTQMDCPFLDLLETLLPAGASAQRGKIWDIHQHALLPSPLFSSRSLLGPEQGAIGLKMRTEFNQK